jgi:hypothetical protein
MIDRGRVLVLSAALTAMLNVTACAQTYPSVNDPARSGPPARTMPPDSGSAAPSGTTVEAVGMRYADHYAGVQAVGDNLIVYRVPGSDLDQAVRSAISGVAVQFRDAPHSRAELTGLANKVQADLAYWQQRGVPIWSVSVRYDGTGVEVGTPAGDALLAAATQRYGPLPIIILPLSGPPATAQTTQ